jgi:alkylation response protein AidB-like acyl-CoA dehydrogenase
VSLSPNQLAAFREVFTRIAVEASQRERERRSLQPEIAALVESGFTAVRVPVGLGGGGATLPEVFDLLIELAAADPNLTQALRGHFGLVERLLIGGTERDELWLRRIADGAVVGNSQSEKGVATSTDTRLDRVDDGWRLTGRKFYTTGTIYGEYTWTGAVTQDGERFGAIVPTSAPGVEVLDDWTGIGQRLTGSGTTVFADVALNDDQVYPTADEPDWYTTDYRIFLHLLLQATMAGIGVTALDETLAFVRARSRSFGVPGLSAPREDPRVHSIVGELSSRVAAVQAIVRDVARDYAATRDRLHADDDARAADFSRVQIRQFEAQQIAVADILTVTTRLYEVGGASAILADSGLDRHWRNARTIASHNPAAFRQAAIGDYLLNGTEPEKTFR